MSISATERSYTGDTTASPLVPTIRTRSSQQAEQAVEKPDRSPLVPTVKVKATNVDVFA